MQRNVTTTCLLIGIGLAIWWGLGVVGSARSAVSLLRAVNENQYWGLSRIKFPFGPEATMLRTLDREQRTLSRRWLGGDVQTSVSAVGRSDRGEFAIWESDEKSTRLHLIDPLTLKTRVSRQLPFPTRGHFNAFSADGKWLVVNPSFSPTLQLLLLSSDTLETVDSVAVPEGPGWHEIGTSFGYYDSQLVVFNRGKFQVVPYTFGSQGAINECVNVSGAAMLVRTSDWIDSEGQPVPPRESDSYGTEAEFDDEPSAEPMETEALTDEAAGPRTQRIRHFIHWPLENRSVQIPNELLGRDTLLVCDGSRLVTYDRGRGADETYQGDREVVAIVIDPSGEEITRFANLSGPSARPVHAIWEALMDRPRGMIADVVHVVRANDGAPLATIDNRKPLRLAHWTLCLLAVVWCVVWIWPALGNGQTLLSAGGALLMVLAIYQSLWIIYIEHAFVWFTTLYSAVVLIPVAFTLWWLFASDWPLLRRLPALLMIGALAWEPLEPFEPYGVLSWWVLLAVGTLWILVRGAWLWWRKAPSSSAHKRSKTFALGDLFLWTTCIGMWMYCAALPELSRDLQWSRLFGLAITNALLIGGSLLLVWATPRTKGLGVVMLLTASGLAFWRTQAAYDFSLAEGRFLYVQAVLIGVLVLARVMLWLLTKIKFGWLALSLPANATLGTADS